MRFTVKTFVLFVNLFDKSGLFFPVINSAFNILGYFNIVYKSNMTRASHYCSFLEEWEKNWTRKPQQAGWTSGREGPSPERYGEGAGATPPSRDTQPTGLGADQWVSTQGDYAQKNCPRSSEGL